MCIYIGVRIFNFTHLTQYIWDCFIANFDQLDDLVVLNMPLREGLEM
jgi:hypothetical protein